MIDNYIIFDITEFDYVKNTHSLILKYEAQMDILSAFLIRGKTMLKMFTYIYHNNSTYYYTDNTILYKAEIRYA